MLFNCQLLITLFIVNNQVKINIRYWTCIALMLLFCLGFFTANILENKWTFRIYITFQYTTKDQGLYYFILTRICYSGEVVLGALFQKFDWYRHILAAFGVVICWFLLLGWFLGFPSASTIFTLFTRRPSLVLIHFWVEIYALFWYFCPSV